MDALRMCAPRRRCEPWNRCLKVQPGAAELVSCLQVPARRRHLDHVRDALPLVSGACARLDPRLERQRPSRGVRRLGRRRAHGRHRRRARAQARRRAELAPSCDFAPCELQLVTCGLHAAGSHTLRGVSAKALSPEDWSTPKPDPELVRAADREGQRCSTGLSVDEGALPDEVEDRCEHP